MTDLTPELIRAVADLIEEDGYIDAAHLRERAQEIEEKRLKEKRLAIAIGERAINAFVDRFETSQIYDTTDAINIGEMILETIKIEYNNDSSDRPKVETTWQSIQQVPAETVVTDKHGTEWVKRGIRFLYKNKASGVWYVHSRVVNENLTRAPYTFVREYGETQ